MEKSRSRSRLKQRLTRMFRASSLLHSTCSSSTSSSILSSGTAATSSRTFSTDTTTHEPISIPRHHLPLQPNHAHTLDRSLSTKTERRVRETGSFYETNKHEGRTCPPASPTSPSHNFYYNKYYYKMNKTTTTEKKKKNNNNNKLLSNGYGFTTSSSDVDGFGFFTTEEKEDETEAFFTSRSFSSDSSEFYQRPSKANKKKKKKKTSSRRPPRRSSRVTHTREEETGFAVVKRSSDPYGDFRTSMVEMIVERQLFGASELECLLQAYLSLNSHCHHEEIIQAFSDIWEVLFSN